MTRIAAAAALLSALGLAFDSVLAAETGEDVRRTEKLPLWELGFGAATLRLPDYRGSDQSQRYALPLPYFIYRGDWFKADREGARAVLIDLQRVEVDVSVAAAVPARNNAAREGMPELAPRVEIGPNANIALWRAPNRGAKLELRSPLRAAFTVERSPRNVGLSFTPHVNLDLNDLAGGWDVGLQVGLIFGDRRFHGYLYGVDSPYATAQRPPYAARGGYAGWQALTSVSRRFKTTWLGAFVRYDSLQGAVIASSPLVKARQNLTFGIGAAWVFGVSDQLVSVEP